MYCIRSDIDP
jgi:hypothetical protein